MNFLQILFQTIKSKVTPLWTQFKLWTNPKFIKTRVSTKLRKFFTETLSIKPRHKKDYYPVFQWLVSKKLCYAILMVIGVLSLYYLVFVNPLGLFKESADGTKTYSYKSVPLRFVDGRVNIKAKSGYIAYTGEVKDGYVEGAGTLYDKDGDYVYIGNFKQNKYCGDGRRYFKSGQLWYQGQFDENMFEGTGTLYRENGSKEYVGGFSQDMKEGAGILYDSSNNQVYIGSWTKDKLIYSELLGKNTEEAGKMYTGKRNVYRGSGDFVVAMKDIEALYVGNSDEEMLDDSIMVDYVYVLQNTVRIGDVDCDSITKLTKALGQPYYEGNSKVLFPEAIAINLLNDMGETMFDRVNMQSTNLYRDVIDVSSFDTDYELYLYSYRYNGLLYTFFSNVQHGDFGMYMIEKE